MGDFSGCDFLIAILIDSVNNEALDDTFAPEAERIYYRIREQE